MQRVSLGIAGVFMSFFLIFYGFTISASKVTPVTFGPPTVHAGKAVSILTAVVAIAVAVYTGGAGLTILTDTFGEIVIGTALDAVVNVTLACVQGYICGGGGDSGGGGPGIYNVAAGTTAGGECYGPANSCGQAYKGTYESDPASGLMGCKISDSFNYGAPAESSCTGPSVTLTVGGGTGITIDSGQSATLAWDSPGADYCVWKGNTESFKDTASGTRSTGPLTQSTSYQMRCADSKGSYGVLSTVTVTVLTPDVSISATPLRVKQGGTSTITWSGKDISSCKVSDIAGHVLASGDADKNKEFSTASPYAATVTTQDIFTITCQTLGDPITNTVIVNVVPSYGEF